MKYFLLAFCFYSLFLHTEINFIDRIAIIVDDGIIMESELNEALENTISNFEESWRKTASKRNYFFQSN